MKVIIAGGRNFIYDEYHVKWLINKLKEIEADEVVCGMAPGADMFGYKVAKHMGLKIKEFPAKWKEFGPSAGPIRNEEMAKYADACILFLGGKGTANMKKNAIKYGLKVIEYAF